jgi:GTP-binding protein
MKILKAQFIKSAASLSDSLPPDKAEVAFLGRSNVGKSSLINALVSQKSLAKSSQTPGKTRLINFFSVSVAVGDEVGEFRLVDLPGFGYAKVSKDERALWERNLTGFLLRRESIKLFLLLRDARHPDMEIDEEVKEFLSAISRGDFKIQEVYTKIDKLKKNELSLLRQKRKDAIFVSSESKDGMETLRAAVMGAIFGG